MKKFSVFWSQPATLDLYRIIEYIAKNQPLNAKKVFLKIKKSAKKLERFPLRGRIVPELRLYGIQQYREIILSPWRLMYKVFSGKVWVMAVIDGRRDIEDILFQRFMEKEEFKY